MNPTPSIITLITDFGTDDFFVGAMKGVILSINPAVTIVDITHSIRPHDIRAAAFTLAHAFGEFPAGTIHVVVVDPGVGSARKPVLLVARQHRFVGPDNGVFSFIQATEKVECIHITSDPYFRKPVSQTFHGRDIFAPVAGWLSKGVAPEAFGAPLTEVVTFEIPRPTFIHPTHLRGQVIHIDRFGNLITNLTPHELSSEFMAPGVKLVVNDQAITRFQTHFAEAMPGEPFAVFGSTGWLEIAVSQDSAERILNATVGTPVDVFA